MRPDVQHRAGRGEATKLLRAGGWGEGFGRAEQGGGGSTGQDCKEASEAMFHAVSCAGCRAENASEARATSVYFLSVNGAENCVVSHWIVMAPPPVVGSGTTASVSWSTDCEMVSFFRSTRATSFVSSTGMPHLPRLLLKASLLVPVSEGTM